MILHGVKLLFCCTHQHLTRHCFTCDASARLPERLVTNPIIYSVSNKFEQSQVFYRERLTNEYLYKSQYKTMVVMKSTCCKKFNTKKGISDFGCWSYWLFLNPDWKFLQILIRHEMLKQISIQRRPQSSGKYRLGPRVWSCYVPVFKISAENIMTQPSPINSSNEDQ